MSVEPLRSSTRVSPDGFHRARGPPCSWPPRCRGGRRRPGQRQTGRCAPSPAPPATAPRRRAPARARPCRPPPESASGREARPPARRPMWRRGGSRRASPGATVRAPPGHRDGRPGTIGGGGDSEDGSGPRSAAGSARDQSAGSIAGLSRSRSAHSPSRSRPNCSSGSAARSVTMNDSGMRSPRDGIRLPHAARSSRSEPSGADHSKYASDGSPPLMPRSRTRASCSEEAMPALDVYQICGFGRALSVGSTAAIDSAVRLYASSMTTRSAEKPRPEPPERVTNRRRAGVKFDRLRAGRRPNDPDLLAQQRRPSTGPARGGSARRSS
jgi:hypothetical protein